jgi:hypothetical protein
MLSELHDFDILVLFYQNHGARRAYRREYKVKSNEVPPDIRRKFRKIYSLILHSRFYGLIPSEQRKKIIEFQNIFPDMFILQKNSPEEWKSSYEDKEIIKRIKQSILIGVIDENCFYLDNFTPLDPRNLLKKH